MGASGLECTPAGERPCGLRFGAIATDPDGDPLTFPSTGPCRAGDVLQADDGVWTLTIACTIPAPGEYISVLTVRDDRGGEASRQVELRGLLNGVWMEMHPYPPNVAGRPWHIAGTGYDGSRMLCRRIVRRYTINGECAGRVTTDSCLIGGFELEIVPSGRAGTCAVTVTVANEVGVEATASISFDPLAT